MHWPRLAAASSAYGVGLTRSVHCGCSPANAGGGQQTLQRRRRLDDDRILAASIRSPDHVTMAALAGSDCATLPPEVFAALFKHPLTERGLSQFLSDWAATGQSIL